jgi:hypothetical protein
MAWLMIITISQLFYGMAYPFTSLFGFYLGCGAILLSQHSGVGANPPAPNTAHSATYSNNPEAKIELERT